MKRLIITSLLLTAAIAAGAKERKAAINVPASLEHAKMQVINEDVKFTNLPKEETELYIMDEHGIVEHSEVISRKQNKVNIADLPKGNHLFALKVGLRVKVFGYMAEVTIR